MVEIRKPISVSTAVEKVMSKAKTGEKITVAIGESQGYFLADDIVADHDVPAFDRSPYDGFAIRAEDTESASRENPIQLQVIGEIGAGTVFDGEVEANQAVRIMTGAQIPSGSNAVIMLEHVEEKEVNGEKWVSIDRELKPQENVTPKGEDTKKGEVIVKKGTYISPGVMAVLATFGYSKVPVSKKPKVGIISTGSELLSVEEELVPGKIRDSNSQMLIGQIERAGGIPVLFGRFKDDFDLCYDQVVQALDEVDIVLTTGGVSVGDYDYIPAILKKLQADVLFNKVKMRPGSVTTVASVKDKFIFGLSGNPSSCYVGFEIFVRPVIRRRLYCPNAFLRCEKVTLGETFQKPNPFDRFVRGKLLFEDGRGVAYPTGLDKPNIVTSLASADVLIRLPGGSTGYDKGTEVDALFLNDQTGSRTWLNTELKERASISE